MINIPGDSWISSVVCSSIDFVHYADILGVVYYNMDLPRILALLSPLGVYTRPPHMCDGCEWVYF